MSFTRRIIVSNSCFRPNSTREKNKKNSFGFEISRMTGFSKTLEERIKTKWAKEQSGRGALLSKKLKNLASRRVSVIEKPVKKSKKRSKKQQKRKKR